MNTDNESELLVKKYFWFLVDNHGFDYYELYSFRTNKMLIRVLPGHKTPSIEVTRMGDDPDLFNLNFEWIIKYFSGTFPSENHDYLKFGLETNMVFISKIFRENVHRLIDEFDEWWIPAHVFVYRTTEAESRSEGQTDRFIKTNSYYYDYLKNEGAI